MKIIAYICFTFAFCVFMLGLMSGAFNVAETFVLVVLGFMCLTISGLRDTQREIQQQLRNVASSIARIESTAQENANDIHGIVLRKREDPRTDDEIADFLSSQTELR